MPKGAYPEPSPAGGDARGTMAFYAPLRLRSLIPVLPRLLPGGRLTAMLVCAGALGMMIEAVPLRGLRGARPARRPSARHVGLQQSVRHSELKVSAGWDRALVCWITDVPTDTVIEFHGPNATGSTMSLAQSSTTRHQLLLRGLWPGTSYRYSIVATDRSGSSSRFGPFDFTTANRPPVSALEDSPDKA